MLKIKRKKMDCIKCPATGELQMIKHCVSCAGDGLDNDAPEGYIHCSYDEHQDGRLITYAAKLPEDELDMLIDKIFDERDNLLEEVKFDEDDFVKEG